jgi:serine protease AprX
MQPAPSGIGDEQDKVMKPNARRLLRYLIVSLTAFTVAAATVATPSAREIPARYLVQAGSVNAARERVDSVGATVERELEIVHGVSARLSAWQADRLRAMAGVRVFADRALSTRQTLLSGLLGNVTSTLTSTVGDTTSTVLVTANELPVVPTVTGTVVGGATGNSVPQDGTGVNTPTLLYQTNYPMRVGANTLQQSGITGAGVTIAMLDSGLWQAPSQNYGLRILATIDVTNGGSGPVTGDPYGHGTHITSIAAGGAINISGEYLSIAPQANLVIVRAFNGEGAGRYVDVISGLDWILANQHKYNIRVVNLSFGAPPESYYWDDPLNQAVMAAWQAGIVVVAAAGNSGPSPMTIDVPGNVPYVITVGALTDNYTPYNLSDDRLASFSSAGPTYEGFVKPEMIAPGGHMVASMSSQSYLANVDPGSMAPTAQMFTMSGTSMAAAVTSGVVALMLQADPALTPDEVKCRLLASAGPAVTSSGTLAYSVFEQGAGLINAVSAVNTTASGCANRGLNIAADLAGTQHFGGPANQNANGSYYVMNMAGSTWGGSIPSDGYTWSGGFDSTDGYSWSEAYPWTQAYSWNQAYPWTNSVTWNVSYAWNKGYAWNKSVTWWNSSSTQPAGTQAASIENWVPNQ